MYENDKEAAMTNEEISMNTKKALSNTLKELMRHKPFRKITVSELIRECNVNRKTFYYHFEDIYALLKWTLEQESVQIIKKHGLFNNYTELISFVYDYVKDNAFMLNCAYDSLGREVLKQFFQNDFQELTMQIIRNEEARYNLTVSDDFRDFLCRLYTEGLAGMLINIFQNPDKYKKEELIRYFSLVLSSSVHSTLTSADADNI